MLRCAVTSYGVLSRVTQNAVTCYGVTNAGELASRQGSKQAKKHCRQNRPFRQIQKPKRASKRTNNTHISHIALMDLGTSRQYEKLKVYS